MQFASTILGLLCMSEEELGFDPTIISAEGRRYVDIKRGGRTERLIIDSLIKRAPCVAGRATTCWKAHHDGGNSLMPLVIRIRGNTRSARRKVSCYVKQPPNVWSMWRDTITMRLFALEAETMTSKAIFEEA